MLSSIWRLVCWGLFFNDAARAYGNGTNKQPDTRPGRWAQGNAHPKEHAAEGTLKRALVIQACGPRSLGRIIP
jgi:hypothetical protein